MPDLEPLQRIFLHMVRDLLLCDQVADVRNDIEDWSKIFGVDVPGGGDGGDGFELDAIDELLACENPGHHGEDFLALVRGFSVPGPLLKGRTSEAEPPVADALAPVAYPYFVVEIEDQDERGLDQHAAFDILRAALPSLGFKLRACGTRESMRQCFADEQARLDREDLAELLTEHRLARAAREAEVDSL